VVGGSNVADRAIDNRHASSGCRALDRGAAEQSVRQSGHRDPTDLSAGGSWGFRTRRRRLRKLLSASSCLARFRPSNCKAAWPYGCYRSREGPGGGIPGRQNSPPADRITLRPNRARASLQPPSRPRDSTAVLSPPQATDCAGLHSMMMRTQSSARITKHLMNHSQSIGIGAVAATPRQATSRSSAAKTAASTR
jgi:hypothetical protein